MSEENKMKKGRLKALLKSRKARHGSISIVITAVVIAIVIVINIICGLINEKFPDIAIDLTSGNSFALHDETVDYVSHLDKAVTVNILMTKNDFESRGNYFVQAKKLLEKMKSNSNGKLKIEYIDLTSTPTFASKYPDLDWSTAANNYISIVE